MKYEYINMGFGNGLYVDKRIFDKYQHYLTNNVKKLDEYSEQDGEYNYCLNFPVWYSAFEDMINDWRKK